MKSRNLNSLIIKVMIVIILSLYAFFLYMDFYNVKFLIRTHYIKYLSIVLCFLLAMLSTRNSFKNKINTRDIFLLRLGMFITVIADLCLVIFDFYILGIAFFTLVQITYAVRYSTRKFNALLINYLIVFLCIVFSYELFNLFIVRVNILLPMSLFYSICLTLSVSKAINVWKKDLYPSPSKYMIVLGMILFLLCDICVALSNISALLPLTGYSLRSFEEICRLLVWVFYLPSQLLLALSGSTKI